MKILFINGQYPFCYYYRGYLPGVYSGNGVVTDFIRSGSQLSQGELYSKAEKSDVLVFQRPTEQKMFDFAILMKKKGKKIIFENDDSYSTIPMDKLENDAQRAIAKKLNSSLNNFAKFADGVIASTPILADEYSKLNSNVVVLKNTIDPLDRIPCRKNDTGKFRIGLIGSVTSNEDYDHIKEDLRRLDATNEYTIVVMGVKFKDGTHLSISQPDYDFWSSLKNVEMHPYCKITEYIHTVSKLALDLAIIPRKDMYFNYCKSNLKFLEMSLLKIPVVAQGFQNGLSPYQGVDEQYMTVIQDNWHDTIVDVKEKYASYKEKAETAHEYVLKNYNIAEYYKEWVNKIEQLCK